MTEENKERTLDYLVGNLKQEQGEDKPQIELNGSLNDTIVNLLTKNGIEYVAGNYKIIYYEKYIIVYNYYKPPVAGGQKVGYILILDENLKQVAFLDKFENGNNLYPIVSMNYDENGQFYAVSTDTYNEGLGKDKDKRLLLLNNIIASGYTTGNYKVILRASYFLKDQNVTIPENQKSIFKLQTEATYFIATTKNDPLTNTITRVKINVGAENEWTNFNLSDEMELSQGFDCYAKKTGDNYSVIYSSLGFNYSNNIYTYNYIEYEIGDETATQKYKIALPQIQDTSGIAANNYMLIKNENEKYCSIQSDSQGATYLFKINGNSASVLQKFLKEGENYINLELQNVGELIFLYYVDSNLKSKLGILINDNIIWGQELINNHSYGYQMAIVNNYNLYTIYIDNTKYTTDDEGFITSETFETDIFQIVYNSTNYNGLSFINSNCLVSNSMKIYASQEDKTILFARNLYNKDIQGNNMTATIQIPNTYLNNQSIGYEELASLTNFPMNKEKNIFTKNIYETVNLNISNTWRILNNNDTTNPIYNQEGANRLVRAISNEETTSSPNNYDNAKIGYYRINYSDGTSEDKETPTALELTKLKYRYTLELTPSKDIDTIQFLSTDKNTIYQTSVLNLKAGKAYRIKQRVRLEGAEDYGVNYNNQRVFYKGQRVNY